MDKIWNISNRSRRCTVIPVTLYLFLLLGLNNDNATAQLYVEPEDLEREAHLVKPLEISNKDLVLQAGLSETVFIYPTDVFNSSFEDEASVTLHFLYSATGVVSPLTDLPLVQQSSPVFENTSIVVQALKAGRVIISSALVPALHQPTNITVNNIFLRVAVFKYSTLVLLSEIVGWIYFFAWSISFYPQIYQNWKRKSVRGLSLDFVFLNLTGFCVYGIFNVGLHWIPEMEVEYLARYPTGVNPVQLNDVIFSLHAIFATSIIAAQCIFYDKGSQTVSGAGRTILMGVVIFLFVMLVVALSNNAISWLTFITVCSYVKLFITLVKYVPQAYLNWSRKSTSGWAIGNVLLDLTGGVFSLVQMLILGYNHNDWTPIFGDLTKFGLGFFSICFDLFFILQHYVLYRNHEAYEPIDGANIVRIVDPYEDMVTSNHVNPGDFEDEDGERSLSSSS